MQAAHQDLPPLKPTATNSSAAHNRCATHSTPIDGSGAMAMAYCKLPLDDMAYCKHTPVECVHTTHTCFAIAIVTFRISAAVSRGIGAWRGAPAWRGNICGHNRHMVTVTHDASVKRVQQLLQWVAAVP